MSGPIVHKATMQKMVGISKIYMPVFWSVGSYLDNIEADLKGPSHGANLKTNPKDYGIIYKHIIPTVEEITKIFKSWNSPNEEVDSSDLPRLIRRVCHYCEDSFTIGQICGPEFWGSKDDKIDLASELVRGKKDLHNNDISFAVDRDTLIKRHKSVMDIVVKRYYKDAKGWGRWVSPREVTAMTKVAVVNGANLASSWVYLAWKDAGEPSLTDDMVTVPGSWKLIRDKYFDRTPTKPTSPTFGLKYGKTKRTKKND